MALTSDFAKMVPGFDFLQGLMKNAGNALPGMGQWIAPTVNPDELTKRIDELRTVQFWLEQNARLLGTTIQALEVQRMTLSTLKSMNMPVADMVEAFKIKVPGAASALDAAGTAFGAATASKAAAAASAAAPAPTASAAAAAPKGRAGSRSKAAPESLAAQTVAALSPPPGVVDPLKWWGALTEQFTQLAAQAAKDAPKAMAANAAGAVMKQSMDAAGDALKAAGGAPLAGIMKMGKAVSRQVRGAAAAPARKSAKAAAPAKRTASTRRKT